MSMNLFTIAPTDQSVYYLGQIFGSIGGVLPVSNAPILLGVMFKVLNTAALSVGAMIVVYTTVAGLLSTASEGEFLGKKWSGMWVPIRTVLGIVGLFPSSGGYCAIQIIIMWLILQGVGLADTLWNAVLNVIDQGGSPYITTSFPGLAGEATQNFKNLFTGLVCYESLHRTAGVADISKDATYLCGITPSDPRCSPANPPFDPQVFPQPAPPVQPSSSTANPPQEGPYDLGKECGGALTYCTADPNAPNTSCPNTPGGATSLKCTFCQAQRQALTEIIPTFDTIAKTFVQMDYDYQKFYYNSNSSSASGDVPQWIQDFCAIKNIQGKCCVGVAEHAAAKTVLGKGAVAIKLPAFLGFARNTSVAPAFSDADKATLAKTAKCSYDVFTPKYVPDASGNRTGPDALNDDVLKDIFMPAIKAYTNNVDFITAAADQYQGVINGVYLTYLATLPPSQTKTAWNSEAKSNGWILAGMYYMDITQRSASHLPSQANLPTLTFNPVTNPEAAQGSASDNINKYRNDINTMQNLFLYISGADTSSSNIAASTLATITATSTTSMNSMLSSFMHDVSGSPGKLAVNPLYKISLWGYNMMIVVQFIFALTTVLVFAAAFVMSLNFLVVGTGMTSEPLEEAFKAAWSFTSPFLLLGLSALFMIGVVLGIYLPLIPYTIFLMGAVGWLMATIEAMVAGPIIALGILSPSGQHELLGKSEPAVMIIFNLILRPALMVFGMMASMLVAVVVVTMINQGFVKVAFNIIQAPGLVEGIFFMMVYTSILVTALNKVFSLIHVIPEKVLTYIGGQAISYGEGEGLQGMKQQIEGGASGISGGAKEAGGAPAAGATKVGQDKAHKAKDEKDKKGASAKSVPTGSENDLD